MFQIYYVPKLLKLRDKLSLELTNYYRFLLSLHLSARGYSPFYYRLQRRKNLQIWSVFLFYQQHPMMHSANDEQRWVNSSHFLDLYCCKLNDKDFYYFRANLDEPKASQYIDFIMMTSLNGNNFHVTGPLRGEITGRSMSFPLMTRSLDFFTWANAWVNNRNVGNSSHHWAHYDVTLLVPDRFGLTSPRQCFIIIYLLINTYFLAML